MKNDPGMQWIRNVRVIISNELGNDPKRFVAFHKKQQDAQKDKAQKRVAAVHEEDGEYTGGSR